MSAFVLSDLLERRLRTESVPPEAVGESPFSQLLSNPEAAPEGAKEPSHQHGPTDGQSSVQVLARSLTG